MLWMKSQNTVGLEIVDGAYGVIRQPHDESHGCTRAGVVIGDTDVEAHRSL